MKNILSNILNNYIKAKKSEKFNGDSPMYQMINIKLRDAVNNILENKNLDVKGSCGKGNWARNPWLAIFNKEITTTIKDGVYIVYLFSEDMERVYITLIQGSTKLKETLGTQETIKKMNEVNIDIRNRISAREFKVDNNLKIGSSFYEKGTIFYKAYHKNTLPDEEEFKKDLDNMVDIYEEYYIKIFKAESTEINNEESVEVNRASNQIVDKIKNIQQYITSKGYIYTYEDLCNFYLSLKTKPFVILAGTSGTGKSKLVRLFGEAIGVTKDDGFNMISVRPDWNDSTDLIGYKNIEDRFVPGKLTNIIKEALSEENREKIYIICLDEMNLARVEYYFSEYLSLIESREWEDDNIVTDRILSEEYVKEEKYNKLHLPDNLYVVGTVNMDDTTFSFSKKVLDRANTIEFSQVDLENLDFNTAVAESIDESNSFLRTSFLSIKDVLNENETYVKEINKSIVEINNILKKGGKHFGYRVRDEIVFYMMENKKSGLLKEETALDYQIMQKILPALSGSDRVIKGILIELYNFCNPNKKIADNVDYIEDGEKHLNDAIYIRSAEKIIKMMRGYDDGYTSFWE